MQTSLQQLNEKPNRRYKLRPIDMAFQERRQVQMQIKCQRVQKITRDVQSYRIEPELRETNERGKFQIQKQMKYDMKKRTKRKILDQPQLKQLKQQGSKFSLFQKTKKISCEICYNKIKAKNTAKLCICQHIFCKECLNKYVLQKIRIPEQIKCPQENCDNLLDQNSNFFKSFPQQIKAKPIIIIVMQQRLLKIKVVYNAKFKWYIIGLSIFKPQIRLPQSSIYKK